METTTDTPVEASTFRQDVLEGLSSEPKTIPCKYLYDEYGSKLFDAICEQEEYYPTRTEMKIMRRYVDEMVEKVGEDALLIEYGSGTSMKTRLLLDALEARYPPAGYVPIEIACEHLEEAVRQLRADYPDLRIEPVCADYTTDFEVPDVEAARRVVYFPGSTIGNFEPEQARAFLEGMATVAGPGGGLLLGVDLEKDPEILRAAYNDAGGVTAAFNENLLRRMKRELGAQLQMDQFSHEGRCNIEEGCMEMHLVSHTDQAIRLDGSAFSFDEGETIRTERSYKYAPEAFARLAEAAGFSVDTVWTDADDLFSVQYLTVA